MNSRHKLNLNFFLGAVAMAFLVWVLSGSWLAAVILLILVLGAGVGAGQLRL